MDIKYNSFVMYHSWVAAIRKLPLSDTEKLEALLAVCDYGFTGEYNDNFAVDMVKEQMDKNIARKENGKMGGRPKNQTETKPKPNNNQNVTKCEPNVNVNDNVNDNVNLNANDNDSINNIENTSSQNNIISTDCFLKENKTKEKRKKFVPPTLEELKNYISEKNYNFTAEEFFDHYTSNGWKVGKEGMKDWRAAANNWERRRNQFNNQNNYNNGRTNNNNSNNGIPKFNDGFSGNYPPEQETIHLD